MTTRHCLLTTIVLALTLIGAGCGDDDSDPTAPSTTSPAILVLGSVSVADGRLTGWIEAWDVTQTGAAIDSVVVDDTYRFGGDEGRAFYWAPEDGYWAIGLEALDIGGYAAGDTAMIELFEGDESALVEIPLLDAVLDRPDVLSAPVQAIPIGAEPVFGWASVAAADFYVVTARLSIPDGSGGSDAVEENYTVTGTSVTLSSALTADDGELRVWITPYRGPMPTEGAGVESNVRTSTLNGTIWSRGARVSSVHDVGAGFGARATTGAVSASERRRFPPVVGTELEILLRVSGRPTGAIGSPD